MKPFRVDAFNAKSAINALYHVGISCEAVRWGDVVYLEVKPDDQTAARVALRPWLLLTWWEKMWAWVAHAA